jgi:hypothetical protein
LLCEPDSTPSLPSEASTTRSRSTRRRSWSRSRSARKVASAFDENLEREFAARKKLDRIVERLARLGAQV